MRLEVLLFGPAARVAGGDRVVVAVRDGATVSQVLSAMAEQHPPLAAALRSARLAVNQAFARADEPVRASDELALIALVGGG